MPLDFLRLPVADDGTYYWKYDVAGRLANYISLRVSDNSAELAQPKKIGGVAELVRAALKHAKSIDVSKIDAISGDLYFTNVLILSGFLVAGQNGSELLLQKQIGGYNSMVKSELNIKESEALAKKLAEETTANEQTAEEKVEVFRDRLDRARAGGDSEETSEPLQVDK